MQHYYYLNYFKHAAQIGEFLFNNWKNKEEKYYVASFMGVALREYGDYIAAHKWFKIAHKLAKSLDRRISLYKEYIELKNCIEMEYYISGEKHFREKISQISKSITRLPRELQSGIEYNLAEASRRTGIHDLEYDYLCKFIEKGDLENPHIPDAMDRVLLFSTTIEEGNYQTIKELELKQYEKQYWERANIAIKSFQYDECLYWIERLLKLRINPSVIFEKAASCRHLGRNQEAIDLYEKCSDLFKRGVGDKTFSLISIAIIQTKEFGEINPMIIDNIRLALQSAKEEFIENPKYNYSSLISPMTYEFVTWTDQKLYREFLEIVVEEFKSLKLSGNPLINIGLGFFNIAIFDEARFWLESSLDNLSKGSERANVYNYMGLSFFQEGNHKEAANWFRNAIGDDGNLSDAYANLAQCHLFLMEYDHALKAINRACDIKPENVQYKEIERQIRELSGQVISLVRIDSEEIKSMFRTGDWLLFAVFVGGSHSSYDIGPVVVQYGKGVETLLFNHILKPVREKIRANPEYTNKKGLKPIYWYGSKENKINSLPPALKTILGNEEKTLSLGQWTFLRKDLDNIGNNSIIQSFNDILEEMGVNKETLNEVGIRCGELSSERNGAAHSTFYTRDEVMGKRQEMVNNINSIINSVSGLKEAKA